MLALLRMSRLRRSAALSTQTRAVESAERVSKIKQCFQKLNNSTKHIFSRSSTQDVRIADELVSSAISANEGEEGTNPSESLEVIRTDSAHTLPTKQRHVRAQRPLTSSQEEFRRQFEAALNSEQEAKGREEYTKSNTDIANRKLQEREVESSRFKTMSVENIVDNDPTDDEVTPTGVSQHAAFTDEFAKKIMEPHRVSEPKPRCTYRRATGRVQDILRNRRLILAGQPEIPHEPEPEGSRRAPTEVSMSTISTDGSLSIHIPHHLFVSPPADTPLTTCAW